MTSGLLPGIAKLVKNNPFGRSDSDKDAVRKLERALSALLPSWRHASPNQPLITDILSLLDQAAEVGNVVIPGFSQSDCAEVRRLLDRALVQVIDEEFDDGDFSPTCHSFVDWVMSTASGVVTTNYDLEFDMALGRRFDKPKEIASSFDFGSCGELRR